MIRLRAGGDARAPRRCRLASPQLATLLMAASPPLPVKATDNRRGGQGGRPGRCATHSAILVGVETVIADDPSFTVRLPGYAGQQPRALSRQPGRTPLAPKSLKPGGDLRRVRLKRAFDRRRGPRIEVPETGTDGPISRYLAALKAELPVLNLMIGAEAWRVSF